ncbi:3-oxoacyl-ACP reductase [Microbulbifer agarilyticus]|uniref:3-oxoacyl-ACP reductase n=1 Tax=Microbulbifer agarilyticus TaxID=260552 RepID=A0A1Q2M4N4_9GAMM|nr:glucose 1-dehydrogenase [Microbulbifer agarilyticus]AQQ67192.1 3-oxoacyl-ACP reductase [Microbulbifer agarilyticus]
MTKRLQDQVAIVTGAADGIGSAIARLFASEGAKVCVADVNVERGLALVEELKETGQQAIFAETDIADEDSVNTMVQATCEQLGEPNILVNNAALTPMGKSVLDVSREQWQRSFSVNVDGMWHCCRAVLPMMKATGGGSIINVGSVHSFKIVPDSFPYAVTKHAVIGLTRNLAVEFGPDNVRVNALCPGMVETPNAFKAWEQTEDPAAARKAIADVHPLRRNASVEEIARPALFLASSESSFMTGHSLVVDGGRSVLYHD